MRFAFALFFVAALLLGSAFAPLPVPRTHAAPQRASAGARKSAAKRTVSLDGVSLTYDAALASAAKARRVAAAEIDRDTKLDFHYVEHVHFLLEGVYRRRPASFIEPEIFIVRTDDYRRASDRIPGLRARVDEVFAKLALILTEEPKTFAGQIPSLPFPHGYRAFHARVKYLRFKGGKGVVFLTQGQQDEMPINNQNLSYEFLGLTDDGRHYVHAQFPVAAPLLQNDRDRAETVGVGPLTCYECPDYQRYLRQYRAYASRVGARLERLAPDKFSPPLGAYDALLASLEFREP